MKPQTIFYLSTHPQATTACLQDIEEQLSTLFQAFCRDHFSFDAPLDYPALRLIPAHSPEDLVRQLFHGEPPHRLLTTDAAACCLFLFDDTLADQRPLFDCTIEGLPVADWLMTYFPTIPKVLITHANHPKCHLPTRRWSQKPFSILCQAHRHRERFTHLFASFWLPQFWDTLRQYVRRHAGVSWHTPGHNNGNAFRESPFLHGFYSAFSPMLFRSDLSVSVTSLGDLSEPDSHSPLAMAQRMASEIFGSAQTAFVTNGTSTSNKAMLMTLLRPGETVLLDRNCHKSVHHAVVMAGAVPRYLPARYNARLGIWAPVALETLQAELTRATTLPEALRPKVMVITTCTYEGILYPVWAIGKACERAGVLFYADEAWASYLGFHPYYTYVSEGTVARYTAVNELAGAHFSVQSTHKALAAFSQASMIHVSNRFKKLLETDRSPQFKWLRKRFHLHGHGSYEKFSHDLHEVLRYWHSTSPHYPMLATLDFAGVQMRLEGLRLIDERLQQVATFRKRIAALVGRPEAACFADVETIADSAPTWRQNGYCHDPLKMNLMFRTEAACRACKQLLKAAHIQWEKSSPTTLLFLVTVGTREEHFESLYRCLRKLKADIGTPESIDEQADLLTEAVAEQPVVLPRDAALCDGELLPLEACEGRIASQLIVPYPPGIPILIPGLRITRPMIQLLQTILKREGAEAIHGLFIRGKRIFVEVLNRDEEARVATLCRLKK